MSVRVTKTSIRRDDRSFGLCVVCRKTDDGVGQGAYRLTTTSSGHTWFTHPYCFIDAEREAEYVRTQDGYHGVCRVG